MANGADDQAVSNPRSNNRLWEFANSGFGLFLLSTVMLGTLSFSYTQWTAYSARQHKIEQLDLEIGLRLRAVEAMATGPEKVRYSNLINMSDVLNGNPESLLLRGETHFQ